MLKTAVLLKEVMSWIIFLGFTYNMFFAHKKKQINMLLILFLTLILTLCLKRPVVRGLSVIGHCYDWLTSLHRKRYQCPLTIACECFDNMIKISDKALLNHLLMVYEAAAVRCSTGKCL